MIKDARLLSVSMLVPGDDSPPCSVFRGFCLNSVASRIACDTESGLAYKEYSAELQRRSIFGIVPLQIRRLKTLVLGLTLVREGDSARLFNPGCID